MSDRNKKPESVSTTDRHKAVVDKVLSGADEVTRRKMGAMLERSSVVEVMAQAHASGKPAGIEDRPIKPDFLNTEQYQLAREAIGTTGEPAPIGLEAATPSPPKEDPADEPNPDSLPSSRASSKTPQAAPSPPGTHSLRHIVVLLAVVAMVAVVAIVLWPGSRAPAETRATPSTAPPEPASGPWATQAGPLPEPPPGPSSSTPVSASTRAEPLHPSSPAATGSSPSPSVPPTSGPTAKPTTAASSPSSTSRFPVQGDD